MQYSLNIIKFYSCYLHENQVSLTVAFDVREQLSSSRLKSATILQADVVANISISSLSEVNFSI